jgi:anti-sigma regulatory factor (Ser/Thr protein kinase)
MSERHHEGQDYEERLPASASSLARFRHSLRRWVTTAVDDPTRATDIVLAASELAAATIRSAPGASTQVVLRAWVDDGTIVVESTAAAKPHGGDAATHGSFDGVEGERGFSVVAALSDTFAVMSRPEGVVVRARLRRERFDNVPQG